MANLKFISTGSTTVTLSGNGLPNSFTANGSAYTLGTAISLSDGQYVQFVGSTSNFSKDPNHYYQFIIGGTGTVTVEGDLISLINNNAYVKQYQFINLFRGCAKITSIANFNFPTSIADWCYANMFLGCTGLTNGAITLPAAILTNWCYANMFAGCSSLVQAPQINATKAAPYSFYCMFQDCSSLLNAPSIVIKNLDKSFSCNSMFRNCQSLSSISVSFNSMTNSNNQTKDWLYNVAANGTFTKSTVLTSYTVGVNGIPNGWTIEDTYPSVINIADQTISFDAMEQSWALETLVYAYNGTETVTFTLDSSLLPNGVYFANGVFSGLGLEMDYNTTTYTQVIPITLSTTTLDAAPVTINATVELYDIPTATIAIDTIPTINWDFTMENSQPSSINLLPYVTYNGLDASLLSTQVLNQLPNGIIYENGVLSANGNILGDDYSAAINYKAYAPDARAEIEQFNMNIEGRVPLKFTGKAATNGIALNKIGSPTASVQYKKNDGLWTSYSFGDIIEFNENDIVAFRGDSSIFSNSSSNYYRFAMTGTIEAKGNIQSLMNYSNSCTNYCYYGLFSGCSQLINAPELPATTLAQGCYQCMFLGCTGLTAVPQLPVTTLANYCYAQLFQGCSKLSSVPENYLQAQTLANACYQTMFNGCTSLTAAMSTLPATTLAQSCYAQMFYNCGSLTAIPQLPATTLAKECYKQMFYGCGSLKTALVLSATTLAQSCYSNMFESCTSLTAAPQLPATTLAIQCYNQMFRYCSKLSTAPVLSATTLCSNCYSYMFESCTSLTSAPQLPATTLADNCYSGMFQGCSKLSTAPILSATTLCSNCYNSMFWGCTSLTSAPDLSATTLVNSCYRYMFNGCTKLSTAPSLPATTLANYCYANMFNGCTSLTATPQLPATTLAEGCYNSMFQGCSKLSNVSILPALTAVQYCYQAMFRECTSLSSVPYNMLPATTLQGWGSYNSMFIYCSNLTNAPDLPASSLSNQSYLSMFRGCSKLSSINVSFTAWSPRNATDDWVTNVAANGTFTCPTALGTDQTINRGANRCPTNWTVINT